MVKSASSECGLMLDGTFREYQSLTKDGERISSAAGQIHVTRRASPLARYAIGRASASVIFPRSCNSDRSIRRKLSGKHVASVEAFSLSVSSTPGSRSTLRCKSSRLQVVSSIVAILGSRHEREVRCSTRTSRRRMDKSSGRSWIGRSAL